MTFQIGPGADPLVVATSPLGSTPRRARALVLALLMIMVALPVTAVGASVRSGQSSAAPVKVGMIYAITSPLGGNPAARDAFQAAIATFNKRGGVGANGAKIKGIICDTRGDANQEVACARRMVDEGVVATLNDLTFNNPAGVVDVLEAAGIPRIGLGPTNIAEFQSKLSYPISAGVIAAYIGTAVGFAEDGNKKVCLVRTDAPTGATFRAFLTPMFNAVGVDIICDVTVATGATDYTPYIAEVQRSNPDAMLISHTDEVGTQLIAAMAQLNAKLPMGGNPGTFDIDTLRKYKDITKGTILSESFPYPSKNNVKNFPGLKQFFADMKASGKKTLQPGAIRPTAFNPWMATLGFVNVTKDLDNFTKETVVQALQSARDVDLLGLTPPWTPSTPGFSVFASSSNHYVYVSRFNGKNVVTAKKPVDVTQYVK
jgi:ABC-type branched-subunit amino acid transport system substrate-binding protein